jgi:hypothetical protein
MRLTRPSRSPTAPPLPRQPLTAMEPDDLEPDPGEPAEPAVRANRWRTGKLRRPRVVIAVVAAAAAVVLLYWGAGWITQAGRLTFGRGSMAVDAELETTGGRRAAGDATADRAAAVKAAAERAARRRAAEDRARAQQMAAAQAADARAAAERAARAEAEHRARMRRQVVAMPALVGLRLDRATDVASKAGLTDVTVCRTPDGDTPLWWSHWYITGQDVPAGARIEVGRQICLSARKR